MTLINSLQDTTANRSIASRGLSYSLVSDDLDDALHA